MTRVELENVIQEYKERESLNRIKEALIEEFEKTEYEKLIPQIIDIVEKSSNSKTLYINSLKFSGKEKGLGVYRQLKHVVYNYCFYVITFVCSLRLRAYSKKCLYLMGLRGIKE